MAIMAIRNVLLIFIPCGLGFVQSSTIVCDVCEVHPLPDFQNKRITGSVLWTKTDMTSRAECAARCSLFRPIKSFGYKDTSRECVAYTVPLTTPAAMTYSSESGFNMYSTCAPVDGGVSAWGQWTGPACPQTCGTSHTTMKTRTRTCTNPAPNKGGADCTESLSETGDFSCGLSECPIDGGVTAWGSWGTLECSQTCGVSATGTRSRTRTCTNPAPAHGGADCPEALTSTTNEYCGFSPCPVNGGVSSWSSWSGSCTQTCGTSHTVSKTRSRTCTNPAPAYGGSDCTETLSETLVFKCGLPACTATSSNFGTCTSSCPGTNVVCNDGLCVCHIMFIKLGSSCVQGCGSAGYGSGFTLFRDKVPIGYNDKAVWSTGVEACMDLCLSESGFTCVTAEYDHQSKICYLSKTPWYNAPPGSTFHSTRYHQLIRNCAV